MQSRLLRAVFEDPQSDSARRFERHLKELVALDAHTRSKCVAAVRQLLKPRTEFQTRQLVNEISKPTDVHRPHVEHSLAIIKFLADALLSDEVPPDDFKYWADDLATFVKEEDAPILNSVVDYLASMRPELEVQKTEERATSGVLPRFKSFGATVEARAVMKDRYRWGTDLDKYRPQVVGVTYVVSVHIGVDEGFPEGFHFQLDGTGLDEMIASLEAARKDVAALREHLEQNV